MTSYQTQTFQILFEILLIGFGYFLPYIIANARRHANASPILLLNLFLGWTVLGWIIALIWAMTSNVKPAPARP